MVAYTGGGAQGLSTRVNPPTVATDYKRQIEKLNEKVKNDAESLGSQERQGKNLIAALRSHDAMTSKVTSYELEAYAKGFEGLTSLYKDLVVKPTIKRNEELFRKGTEEATLNSVNGQVLSDDQIKANNKIRALETDLKNKTVDTEVQVLKKTGNVDLAQKIGAMPEAYRNGFLVGKQQLLVQGISTAYFNGLEDWKNHQNADGSKGKVIEYTDQDGIKRTFNVNDTLDPAQAKVVKQLWLQEYSKNQIWEINPGMFDTRFVQEHFTDPAWKELAKIQKDDEIRFRVNKAVERQGDLAKTLDINIKAIKIGDNGELLGAEVAQKNIQGWVKEWSHQCSIIGESKTCNTDALDALQTEIATIQAKFPGKDKEGQAEMLWELVSKTEVEGPDGKKTTLAKQWPKRFSKHEIRLKAAEIFNKEQQTIRTNNLLKADNTILETIKKWDDDPDNAPVDEAGRKAIVERMIAADTNMPHYVKARLRSALITDYKGGLLSPKQAERHLLMRSEAQDNVIIPGDLVRISKADEQAFKDKYPNVEFRKQLFLADQPEILKEENSNLAWKVKRLLKGMNVDENKGTLTSVSASAHVLERSQKVLKYLEQEARLRAKILQSNYAEQNNGAILTDGRAYEMAMKEIGKEFDLANTYVGGVAQNKGRLTIDPNNGFTDSFWDDPGDPSTNVQLARDIRSRVQTAKNSTGPSISVGTGRFTKGGRPIIDYHGNFPVRGDYVPPKEIMEVRNASQGYIIITDPHLLNNPEHPLVIEAARELQTTPKLFLENQRRLLAGPSLEQGDEPTMNEILDQYPGEALIVGRNQNGPIIASPLLRLQSKLGNPNPIVTNRALNKTSTVHDKTILNGQWGDFNVNQEHLTAARTTYPDQPILAAKEALRLAQGIENINDPKLGLQLQRLRLLGLNFQYSTVNPVISAPRGSA